MLGLKTVVCTKCTLVFSYLQMYDNNDKKYCIIKYNKYLMRRIIYDLEEIADAI